MVKIKLLNATETNYSILFKIDNCYYCSNHPNHVLIAWKLHPRGFFIQRPIFLCEKHIDRRPKLKL